MVNVAVKQYKITNKVYWLFFAFEAATFAKYLNKPTSSKNIERIVIEKNKTIIFNGLTDELLVIWLNTSFIGAKENTKSIVAPINAMIQYVPTLIFPILIDGKNKIDNVMSRNVVIEITMVGIIKMQTLVIIHLFI